MPNGLMWRWKPGPLNGVLAERTIDGAQWRLMAYPVNGHWSAVAWRDGSPVASASNLEDEEEARGAITLAVNRLAGLVSERRV